MSENQNRDFSKYDSMPTEELEEILRLDCEASDDEGSDEELIFYVMGVLAERKRNSDDPGITAQEAWESFLEHYLPVEEEEGYTSARVKKTGSRWLRRVIAAAAVVAILVGIPVAANAFGWEEIWNAVAKWAKETFSFVTGDQTDTSEPSPRNTDEYTSLQEALEETNRATDIVPAWIPERYKLDDITIAELPEKKTYIACYMDEEKTLIIQVRSYLNMSPEKVEINEQLIEIYEVSGVEYYIFSNFEQLRVVWIKDSYECYISGELTIEELKSMIDSIGKG